MINEEDTIYVIKFMDFECENDFNLYKSLRPFASYNFDIKRKLRDTEGLNHLGDEIIEALECHVND